MVVRQILDESDAFRRGLEQATNCCEFAGRAMTSTNQYKNILGIFPKEWRVPMTVRRKNDAAGAARPADGAPAAWRRNRRRQAAAADAAAPPKGPPAEDSAAEAVQGAEGLLQLALQRAGARRAARRRSRSTATSPRCPGKWVARRASTRWPTATAR